MRGEAFDWFLPPGVPGTVRPMPGRTTPAWSGRRPTDARLLRGERDAAVRAALAALRQRSVAAVPEAWSPAWNAYKPYAFGYFRQFTPIARIGHSILVYRVTPRDSARLARWRSP